MITEAMFPMNNLIDNKKHYLLLQKWNCKTCILCRFYYQKLSIRDNMLVLVKSDDFKFCGHKKKSHFSNI